MDRSPLVVTGHAERPPDFVSAATHRGLARVGRLPTSPLLNEEAHEERTRSRGLGAGAHPG